ncbi:MAG TPA: M56 family metallopeptidase [Gemmatimonadales bacterium]|nr:M56 family metallopeptidase [Gemmatimonadota bacterium]HPF62851.1 M56 family metallopeptidase [Gemmatimonadales bacterium]HRX19394.1 M56 family metallopeptidase [Gemmatimonadales bacterium]
MNPFAVLGPPDFYGRIAVEAVTRGALFGLAVLAVCALLHGRRAHLRRPMLVAAMLAQPLIWLIQIKAPAMRWRALPGPSELPVVVPIEPLTLGGAPLESAIDVAGATASVDIAHLLLLILGGVWLLGASILMVRVVVQHASLRRTFRDGRGPNATCRAALAWLQRDETRGRPVRVLVRPDVDVPMAFGVRRPVILLPDHADRWTAEQARAILGHELAHVRNGDMLALLVARVACAIAWCNPVAHLLARRLRAEQEAAADAWVVARGISAPEYVESVVATVRPLVAQPPAAALAFRRAGSALRDRMRRVLRDGALPAMAHGTTWRAMLVAPLLAVAVATLARAGWQPRPGVASGCAWQSDAPHLDRTRPGPRGASVWDVRWQGDGCRVIWQSVGQVRLDLITGRVELATDADTLRMHVDGPTPRDLVVARRGGVVVYTVEGADQRTPPRWLAGHLIELDRHTGFAARARIPELLRAGGVEAVVSEARQATGRHAGLAYLQALVEWRGLQECQLPAILEAATQLGGVDAALASLLDATRSRFALQRRDARESFADAVLALRRPGDRERLSHARSADPRPRILPETT